MSVYAVGDTLTIWVVLLDALGVAITTAIDANFSEAIDHQATDGTLTAATVGTWAHRNNGRYYATIGSAAEGQYSGTIAYAGPPVQVFSWEADVIAAAADPAALATAIAAVQATATAINDNVDVAVSSRASAAVWTSARASKVDQIGSAAAIIAAGSLQDGGRLELRRGDSYLAADGNAKTWSYTGPAIASATLTLRTFAGATVLQVPVTLAGETLSADLTIPQTMALALGTPIYRYEIEATLSAGGTSTLASGDVWTAD